jgi:hypothetical protein
VQIRSSHPLIYRAIAQSLNQKDYLLNHFYINGNQTTICFFEVISLFKILISKNEGSKPPSRSHNESH